VEEEAVAEAGHGGAAVLSGAWCGLKFSACHVVKRNLNHRALP